MRIKARSVALTLPLVLASHALGQINSGMITGVVTDPQKAVVPHARVEVVEDATHYSYSVVTNESGEYTVPYLKAGTYSVNVTAPGFPAFHLNALSVATDGITRADVELRLSSDGTIDSADTLLQTLHFDGLAGFATTSGQVTVTLPGAPGQPPAGFQRLDSAFLGFIIDPANAVAESNKANNSNQGSGVDLAVIAPSLDGRRCGGSAHTARTTGKIAVRAR